MISDRIKAGLAAAATAPLTALAREEITVVINGAEMVIDVVRDARHLGGDGQRYFLCPDCSRKVWHPYVRDERLACRKCAALDYRSRHVRRRGAKSCAPAAPEARALQLDCWGRSRRSLRVDVVTIGLGPLRSSRLPKVGSLVCSTL